jgi:hypothetical protein
LNSLGAGVRETKRAEALVSKTRRSREQMQVPEK